MRLRVADEILIEGLLSRITSETLPGATGNSGGITIETGKLLIQDSGSIRTNAFGKGNSRGIRIVATEDINLENNAFIDSRVFIILGFNRESGTGNSGSIDITATNLSIRDGAFVNADTLSEGDSGGIRIVAEEDINLENNAFISSRVLPNATGDSRGVSITANNLSILSGAVISALTAGTGDSGLVQILSRNNIVIEGKDSGIVNEVFENSIGSSNGVEIKTVNLFVLDGAFISTSTDGNNGSGTLEITAERDIVISGQDSSIANQVLSNAVGDSGGIDITANDLSILNGAVVSATTEGEGDSGMIRVIATGNVVIREPNSFLVSQVASSAVGNSGGISVEASNLLVADGALISSTTDGAGDAGSVNLFITGDLIVQDSSILSLVSDATGNSMGINIAADNLFASNNAVISAATLGEGDSGKIKIATSGDIFVQDSGTSISTEVGPDAVGNSNGMEIITNSISIIGGADIGASTFGQGNAGPIIFQSNDDSNLVVFVSEDSVISTATGSEGDGGGLTIMSDENLTIRGPGQLTTESLGTNTGIAGNLNIFADSVLLDDGVELSTQTESVAGGGNINFQVDEGIILRRGSFINAESTNETPGSGSGGNINLNANFVIAIPAENSDIIANAVGGDGGNILVNAAGIFGFTEQGEFQTTDALRANRSSDISASSQSGQQGSISLNADFEQTQTLDELPDSFINADQLVASSCIARSGDSDGAFVIAGSDGLAQQPDDAAGLGYSTGAVQTVPEARVSQTLQEPEGVYQLADGRLVMSYECEARLQDSSLDID